MLDEPSGLQHGCIIPALQAVMTGVLAGGVMYGFGYVLGVVNFWPFVILGFSMTGAGVFVLGMGAWLRWTYKPEPEPVGPFPELKAVRVELKKDSSSFSLIQLPCSPEQLHILARGVLSGVPLAESSWTGHGKPFSKPQFHQLRDELVKRGLAAWRNEDAPAQGVELLEPGLATFQEVINSPALARR